MPDLKFNPVAWSPTANRQNGALGQARTLQTANRQALRHLGWPIESTGDPKGSVLRQLRLHQGIDPAWLATEACMSLSQLYELEDGAKSRFYSDSLRRQAGRRIAYLLGTDWDRLPIEDSTKVISASNVVPLQRSSGHTLHAVSHQEHPTETCVKGTQKGHGATVNKASHPTLPSQLNSPDPGNVAALPDPSQVHEAVAPDFIVKQPAQWPMWAALLLVIAIGVAAGYMFVQYSSYRLYWSN